MEIVRPLRFADGALEILDQTLLPAQEVWVRLTHPEQVIEAIKMLRVRGAPAIGVAGAFALVLAAGDANAVRSAAPAVAAARPTAVNLSWAVERMLGVLEHAPEGDPRTALLEEAHNIRAEDEAACRAIGRHGAPLLEGRAGVMTHCNAGSLATAGYGTALGIIYAAVERGAALHVYANETRPLLQGARLTAWELQRAGVPVTLSVDSAAASLMQEGLVQAVVVGADRIAANGDVANKVGTYPLALAARAHEIPFYVAAPRSTIDPACPDGASIPIEERAPAEVAEGFGPRTAPNGVRIRNPAFDVTPSNLITALVTEAGVVQPLNGPSIAANLEKPGISAG